MNVKFSTSFAVASNMIFREEDMNRGRSSVSNAKSYKEIGDYWDVHDLSDVWDQTKKVEFEVDIKSEITYYPN